MYTDIPVVVRGRRARERARHDGRVFVRFESGHVTAWVPESDVQRVSIAKRRTT